MEEYKKSHKNNKSEISVRTWDKEFELPDESDSVSSIQDYQYIIHRLLSISFKGKKGNKKIRNALDLGDKIRKKIKIQAFDSSQFFGKSHFEDDGTPSYLVFKPVFRYFTTPNGRKRTLV